MITSVLQARLGRITFTMLLAVAVAAGGLSVPAASAQAAPRPAAAGRAAAGGLAPAGAVEPPGREWASFAYDPRLRESVLFGGQTATAVLGDTWTRHDAAWAQQQPVSSPSARTGAAMVYDNATGQLLLFGGSSRPFLGGGFFGDTWVWTGATWTQLHPATSPSPRDSESLVYDQATRTAIMYGGFSLNTGRLSDTWSWNGTTWTQLSPALAPPGRAYGALTYDPHTQRILLSGGSSNTGETIYPARTWGWDATSWYRAG